MHVHFLDPFFPANSFVHRLDARVKLILALAFILATSIAPFGAWPVYILLLTITISIAILSELGVSFVMKRSALALVFILAAFPVIFTVKGAPAFSLELGAWDLVVTWNGLERFISIAFKSWVSVQVAILLATTTPFPELLVAMRAIHIPKLLVAIFGLMWRYLFVLADEALRLMRARACRSAEANRPGLKTGGSLTWRARVTGGMAGNLFLRAFERSDRIYLAMLSRGYDGEVRSMATPSLKPGDRSVLFIGLGVLVGLLVFALVFWG